MSVIFQFQVQEDLKKLKPDQVRVFSAPRLKEIRTMFTTRWRQFHTDLQATAYMIMPATADDTTANLDRELMGGFSSVVERLVPDEAQVDATSQLTMFRYIIVLLCVF